MRGGESLVKFPLDFLCYILSSRAPNEVGVDIIRTCSEKAGLQLKWRTLYAMCQKRQPCTLFPVPVAVDLHWLHIAKNHLGKLSKSFTRLANGYSFSTTPVAVPDSFDNCCTCSIGKEQSIPVVIYLWCKSTRLQFPEYIKP